MEIFYAPKLVKAGKWAGQVVLKPLSFDERFDLVEAATEGKLSNVQLIRKVVKEHAGKMAVNLTRNRCGTQFATVEALAAGTPDCHEILTDCANVLLQGDEADDAGNGEQPT
jgi:hypothetical protein